MRARHRVRAVVNAVNLSTPLGLFVAKVGADGVYPGPRGILIARGYRLALPVAPAFTVGNVVIVRTGVELEGDGKLLRHEERHTTQYAWNAGPVMVVLYLCAAGVSWLLSANFFSYNPYERLAGLADGGYPSLANPLRPLLRRLRHPLQRPLPRRPHASPAPSPERGPRLVGSMPPQADPHSRQRDR